MGKRISRASKKRLMFFGTLSLICIISFVFSLIFNIYTIFNLTIEKKQLENKYIKLQEESEKLKKDVEKLNDPDYLADYAREKYLYSTQGEYIIQMEEVEETIQTIDETLNKNYIITAIVILIIIYLIFHRKRKRKK